MIEEWKDVLGFEGFYQVSSEGNVRSVDRKYVTSNGKERFYKGKLLTPSDAGKGYKNVMLSAKGRRATPRVCRIVAEAFVPNPKNLPQVNHKDENKSNDRADNLEWCTAKYNTNYGTGLKRRSQKISKKVLQFDLDGNLIAEWESISAAGKTLGIDGSHITRCCKGKLFKSGGYRWKYADN